MNDRIKVLLADDHAIVRMGLFSLLESEDDIVVVGQAEDGIEAVNLATRLKPDIVIMDLQMPRKDGVAATEEIHSNLSTAKVILLTTFASSDGIFHALENGAQGALLKNNAETELPSAIRKVASGGQYISPEVRRQLKANPPIPKLTTRQTEIMTFMAKGSTSKEIANAIGISTNSVNEHIETIIRKVGATNRTEAIAIALKHQLLKI